MNESDVFLLSDDLGLVKMQESPYEREDVLQALLENHPDLLVASATGGGDRLLLISREAPVPDREEAPGRWAVDHLFVDSDAVPVLVEVKRSTDTRIRREMIGQMLDYAANAATFWTAEQLARDFTASCELRGEDPEALLAELLDNHDDLEAFWRRVADNLDAGRMRLVFVADRIPLEVQRVVEFLNDQMSPAEVLAVEIRQYLGTQAGVQTIVPRLLGQTAKAKKRKAGGPAGRGATIEWDEASVLEQLPPAEAQVANEIFQWAHENSLNFKYGRGPKEGNVRFHIPVMERDIYLGAVITKGNFNIGLQVLKDVAPFNDESALDELIARYHRIEGFHISPRDRRGWRPVPLALLTDPTNRRAFFDALTYHVDEIKGANA